MEMKCIIISLVLLSFQSFGQVSFLPATNETDVINQAHSFDVAPNVIFFDVMATYVNSMYPQYTNHMWSWSHSGSGLQGDYEDDEGARTMPFFHMIDTNLVAWDVFMAGDDNGGYTSNQVIQWSTNIMAGPVTVWNNVAEFKTNEGITFPTVFHMPIGGPPEDSASGGGANQINRNAAATNIAALSNSIPVDMWHLMWTNGVSTDVTGNRYFGFYPGNHPFPAGYLCMALKMLIVIGAETNVWSCTLNYGAGTVSATNQMCMTGLNLSGSTLIITNVHFNRMATAWDVPGILTTDGVTTNDCRNAFLLMPELGNSFNQIIKATNMPAGNYNILVNGQLTDTATDVQLAAGRNWFTNYNGPIWTNRFDVLSWQRVQEGNNKVTLTATHDASGPGYGGNYDLINYYSSATTYPGTYHGTNYITQMIPLVSGMRALDTLTHNSAQQPTYTIVITPALGFNPAPFR